MVDVADGAGVGGAPLGQQGAEVGTVDLAITEEIRVTAGGAIANVGNAFLVIFSELAGENLYVFDNDIMF